MNINERKLMYSYLSSYVDNFTSAHWGNSFVTDLYSSHQKANISQVQQIGIEYIDMIKDKNVIKRVKALANFFLGFTTDRSDCRVIKNY